MISYYCLRNNKSTRLVEVAEADLRALIYAALQHVKVDEVWYMRENPDVAEAIRSGVFATAAQHYQHAGYFEGRIPVPVTFDENWYLQQYTDVAEAVKSGTEPSGRSHFFSQGFREGRLPHAGWPLLDR